MSTPLFISKLNGNVKRFKNNLWVKSNNAFKNSKNQKLKNSVIILLIISLLIILVSCFFITREYIKGDYPIYGSYRTGAICNDGSTSESTGSGTCSHHGGVDYWIYPEIDYHYMNPKPYGVTILCTFIFMTITSIFVKLFRSFFIALLMELIYLIGVILYSALFLIIKPFHYIFSSIKN